MMRSWRFLGLILFLSVAGILFFVSRRQQAALQRSIEQTERTLGTLLPVQVVTPERRDLMDTVRLTGTIRAKAEVSIGAEVIGKIVYVGAEEGDFVRAGQVLIRLDDSLYRAQVEQARAAYRQALVRYEQVAAAAQIPSTQADTDIEQAQAQRNQILARLRQLKQQRELTYKETDLALEQADAAVESAENRVRELERQIEITDEQLKSQLQQAQAERQAAELTLKKLQAGARPQEKEQARQALVQAESNLTAARLRWERAQKLFAEGAIAQADLDEAKRLLETAQAARDAAQAAYDLVVEGPRPEDLEIAKERLRQAEAAFQTAKALQKQRDILKSQLSSARALLRQTYAQRELAKAARVKREMADLEIQALEAQLKQVEASLKLAKAGIVRKVTSAKDVEAARVQLDQARANLESALANLEKTVIVAPVSGTVASKMAEVGATAAPGAPLMQLVSEGPLELEGIVAESEFRKIQDGQPVSVLVDSLAGQVIRGVVRQRVPVAQGPTRQFTIRIALPPNLRVPPGSFARAEIVVGKISDALVIPTDAVTEWEGRTIAYVVRDGKVQRRSLKIGARKEGFVQVLSGISESDQVVRGGLERLSDGMPVQVVTGESP
ncbi:MAG: efflux RND transporter periplasmic adaptor subunit [Armatimonadetes bacterium]|nr:efflux RND transporter periplasmic adaptor subunit [Armatimonadota bacterium]MDW8122824.1 efflux RND transporter periplasmic adaptor subunit [Armatimonadota bacterium]